MINGGDRGEMAVSVWSLVAPRAGVEEVEEVE